MTDYERRVREYRLNVQFEEAFGSDNRWFCSRYHGKEIDAKKVENRELLMAYFIRSGGAADFCRRFKEAMGKDNRWYCSQFYNREISDPEILWEYYKEHANDVRPDGDEALAESADGEF